MKKFMTRAFAFLLCAVMLATCAPLDGFVFEAEAASYSVGDTIIFGEYPQNAIIDNYLIARIAESPQDSDGFYLYEGKRYKRINSTYYSFDPIEWRVLSVGSDGIYIMAEKILDYRPYHTSYTNITWAFCTLRTWLNNDFYNTAFTTSEKAKILTTHLANGDNPWYGTSGGIDTYDKIFIPSVADVLDEAYGFVNSTSSSSTRQAQLTGYSASLAGTTTNKTYYWWLRSPGSYSSHACRVNSDGYINGSGSGVSYNYGIRPALKLNPGSAIYKSKSYNSYAVKAVDNATGNPISGASVVYDGRTVGTTNSNGVYTLKVGSDEDSNKTLTLTKSGYSTETRRLYELNSYATNTIAMQNGIDISQSLASLQFAKEKVTGPSVTILGKTFSLFSFDAGIDISGVSIKAKQNTKEKTIEYIIGIGDGISVESDENFSKNYKEFKEFFSCFSNGANYNAYRKIRSKLNKFDGDIGFDADLSVAGYMEFDYSTGDLVYKEGGMVVTAEATVSQDIPFAYICYATFKIGGEVEGKLYIKKQSSGELSPGGSFGIAVKPTIGVGAKLISKDVASVEAGINGSIGGSITLPASALREALSLDISAGCYVKAKALWIFEASWSKTLNCNLYPNFGDITINSADAVIDYNDFEPIARDYLDAIQIETQSIDETINNSSVYPYADPQLVELDDGRIVALWLGDNGTKSTMNLTTLYYSVYENGTWSTAEAVYESGYADNEPKICTDGEKVYALWQRGNEVFSDDASLDYMLAHTDLVYAEFDGEWTEPVAVGNVGNGMYPSNHSIAAENGTVAIAWAQDSENFAEDTDGTTTVYIQQNIDGTWGEVNTATTLNNMSSLAIGFVDGIATIAYTTDTDGDTATTGDSEVYIGSTQLTSDEADDYGVTYQNGEFYYLSGGYLASNNTVTNLYIGGNYSVLTNGATTAVVYPVADGYKSELYVAYKETDGYSTPVALTSKGKHVADYSAIIDSENTIVAAMAVNNIDENATDYPYTTTDFIIDNIGQLADLEMAENIYYDTDSVVAGNPVTFTATFKNTGTAAVNGYTLNLKDSSGTLVAAYEYEVSVASGETVEANVIYTLPDDFARQIYTVEVVSADDGNEANNSTTVEIGYADIEVVSCEITDGTIIATITNNGYETVTGAKVNFSRFITESATLGTVAIGEIAPGEVKTAEYILPASQLTFDTPYSSNRFVVEVTSDTEEISAVNNTAEVLYSPKAVEGISLHTSELTIDIGTKHQLLATVAPSDAYNKVVHWVSDSTNIVEVDEYTGELTAVSGGTAIITAITDDGGFVAQCVVTVNVGVTSVDMSRGEADMTVGQSLTLTANITPTGASNQNVTWVSSNEKVATVANGVVTALKTGETTITVTTEDGGYTAECIINVTNPVTGIAISDTTAMMYLDGTKQLTATVAPLDADDTTVIWSSSDDYTVSVDQSGLLTALGTGTAVITAKTQDGGYTATCSVTVGKHVSNVILSESSLILNVGYSQQLTATILPLNATDKSVEWLSTNENVATVDENGNVTALKAGTATIIVSTNDGGYYATCEVFVCSTVVGFELTNKSELLTPTETVQMLPVFEPADAENQNITWTSSDATIASVDENGLVTGNKTGSAVIIATTDDGGYRDYCMVRVVSIAAQEDTNTVIDLQSNSIYGLDAGIGSLDDYVTVSDEDCTLEYEPTANGFGTGTVAMLTVNGEIVDSYTVVIFGDVNGDGWYDGEDAVIVNLIAKGLLDEEDVGIAIWAAADCNHDGVIDESDVDLLTGAGLLLNEVDQSATAAELETNAAYIEYTGLIDQSFGMDVDNSTAQPDNETANAENTTVGNGLDRSETDNDSTAPEFNFEAIIADIFNLIKNILLFIFSIIV